jgi:hypothetical protein
MLRRRFIASAVACVAGLFGLKAAKGERVEELSLSGPVHYACLRLSDGKVLLKSTCPKGAPGADYLSSLAGQEQCFRWSDRAAAFSYVSQAHAIELAEAARLRYILGSAMKANV